MKSICGLIFHKKFANFLILNFSLLKISLIHLVNKYEGFSNDVFSSIYHFGGVIRKWTPSVNFIYTMKNILYHYYKTNIIISKNYIL